MSVAAFRQQLQGRRADFVELSRLNSGVKLCAFIGLSEDPGFITGYTEDAHAFHTRTTGGPSGELYWSFAFAPPSVIPFEDGGVFPVLRSVGRVCREVGAIHPLFRLVGHTAPDDFWLMLLFHAAWSGPPAMTYTAFNDLLGQGQDSMRRISREEARLVPRRMRSTLSTNPFDASATLIDVLVAETTNAGVGLSVEHSRRVPGHQEAEPARPVSKLDGWTRAELIKQANHDDGEGSKTLSQKTFDRIRAVAKIPSAARGGAGAQRRFSVANLRALITAAEVGRFQKGPKIAAEWRKYLPPDEISNCQ